MININLPEGAKSIINKLTESGHHAYVVGGCVRDSLLKRSPNDWDITTDCFPEETISIFSSTHNVVPTGLKHGTVTLIGNDNFPYEVTTYRIDGTYSDGRHPDNVSFTNDLKEDLSRRDFTINAIAYNEAEGFIDYFGGVNDIENKLIRCVGNAYDRFNEDALRMMRALRFKAQLGFNLDGGICKALDDLSPNIKYVSIERIREEFDKILLSNPFVIRDLEKSGLLKHFIPEYGICEVTEQNHPYHVYTVAEHILHTVDSIEADLPLRLTMFFHDIAKPKYKTTDENGIDHFYNHALGSYDMAEVILKRMKYDNKTIDKVLTLIKYHDYRITQKKQLRKLLNKMGEDNLKDLLKVKAADASAQNPKFLSDSLIILEKLKSDLDEILKEEDCFRIKDLKINGKDLLELGAPKGKAIGDLLNQLLDLVLENPEMNEREKLLKIAKEEIEKI